MKLFFTDWEGPWVTTDFAFEISKLLFKNSFFERLSQYDDYLSYIKRKEDYEAGDTLKLLAPFLIASGVTSEKIKELSRKIVNFVPDAEISIKYIKIKPVVISTSYSQFLEESTGMLGINAFIHGTEFNPEEFRIKEEDVKMLNEAVDSISSLPEIKIKPGMKENELDESSMEGINWLNEFFWEKIMNSSFGDVLRSVKATGGERKREIVQNYVENFNIDEILAIGDSISDHAMLKWVKEEGGIAISFNGNEYAIKNSNVAVVSDTAFGEVALIDVFARKGIKGVLKVVRKAGINLIDDGVSKYLHSTKFYWIEDSNIEEIIEESGRMRRKLRGEAGELG